MSSYRRRRDRSTGVAHIEKVRGQILAAAYQFVAEGGPPALTIAGVANRLHRRPSSICRYFRGLDELLDAVTVRAREELVELLQDEINGRTGREALEALLEAQRLYAQARPGLYEAAMRRPTAVTPAVERVSEAHAAVERAALQACGASVREASRLAWCLRAAVMGAISLEASDRCASAHELDEHFDRIVGLIEAVALQTVAPSARARPSQVQAPAAVGARQH